MVDFSSLCYLDDSEAALVELEKAAQIDPSAFQPRIEIARACLYLKRFLQAREFLDHLLKLDGIPELEARKIYDLHLQYFSRYADHLESQHESIAALEYLEQLRTAYESCPNRLCDRQMVEKLVKAIHVADRCVYRLENMPVYVDRAISIKNWLEDESSHSS
jgi:tetratricopeptide (TPR) repeat protein